MIAHTRRSAPPERSIVHPRHPRRTLVTATAVGCAAVGSLAAIAAAAPGATAAPSSTLVLSEVFGGGGNTGAPFQNDFVELLNRSASAADLTGWSVQYLSASPAATTTWQVTPLTGGVAAGGHFLVQEGAGSANPPAPSLPTPDATGVINMSGSNGTVALVHGTAALTCKTAGDCAADPDIIDLVGYGTAVVHEGSADAPGLSNTTSARRADGPDTDQNGADFTAAAPAPQNTASAGTGGGTSGGSSSTPPPPPTPGPLRIHDIQGSSWVSPQAGNTVTDVPGIVTAVRTSSSKGFWIQDPTPDANPATSEGVFVFTSSTPTVAVGDSVLVSGTVSDYYALSSGETVSTTSNLSVTELTKPTTTVLSHGNALPAPVVLGPGTVPDTYAPDLGGANIETTPITPSRSALDTYESLEGMRVEIDDARVVGPSNSYGETYVTSKPAEAPTYRGGTELLGENRTPSGRIEVVPLTGGNPGADVGDVLTGATVGPLDWSSFGGYVIDSAPVTVAHHGLAPVVATPGTAKQLTVATYNVENLAPGDSAAKYQALGSGVVTNLGAPDIVALEEVQDNTGATDDGTVAADATLTKLTDAIVAAGGPHYAWREIDPANDQDGGQPGGNIRVAFLFDPSRVSFVDAGPADVNRTTTGTQVVKSHGKAALTLSPGRIDPTNPVWTSSRKPLVGEFLFDKQSVFVIANHFDSKGGDQNADGRFQYPQRSSEVQRAGQAQVVHDFVQSLLAVDKKAQVVVVGDLNDYQFSPALSVLRTGSAEGAGEAILTDLIATLPVDQRYTYVYEGISQVLDHILVSPTVDGDRYQVVHVNAEFPDQTSDHDPQVGTLSP
ncbi:MAG: lamin tail domain-containing protein [Jatrophihabitans sp.]|uniref:lamin tail domain-containing protein n=1 Tax=Jatrophihabitans sp. TaxID=1932789 RepID=UPI003F81FB81